MENRKIIQLLKVGKIVVIPTDTIYGIVGSALNPEVVEEIYKLRKRALNKPMIILISSISDLKKFDIKLNNFQKEFLLRNWPNPLSVVLKCDDSKFKYLHRGTNTLAFRMPKDKRLMGILERVGPLVVPSANFEGEKPAENIEDAEKNFGGKIAFYIDGGTVSTSSSTLIELKEDSVNILRQGDFKF